MRKQPLAWRVLIWTLLASVSLMLGFAASLSLAFSLLDGPLWFLRHGAYERRTAPSGNIWSCSDDTALGFHAVQLTCGCDSPPPEVSAAEARGVFSKRLPPEWVLIEGDIRSPFVRWGLFRTGLPFKSVASTLASDDNGTKVVGDYKAMRRGAWANAIIFAIVILFFLRLPFLIARRIQRRRRSVCGACLACGYDLCSLQAEKCPECGTLRVGHSR